MAAFFADNSISCAPACSSSSNSSSNSSSSSSRRDLPGNKRSSRGLVGCCCFSDLYTALGRGWVVGASQTLRKAKPGRSLVDILGEDMMIKGGASVVAVYSFLNVWEVYFATRPAARLFMVAARSVFRGTGRPFCIVPEDIARLRAFLRDTTRPRGKKKLGKSEDTEADLLARREADFVGRLLRAAPEPVATLALPFGVSNAQLRGWVRAGLLRGVEELHLMGHGGPSDAGLAHVVARCPKIRVLTLLCSSVTAAAALVLHAQVKGELSCEWWRSARFSSLCVLPRLRAALQPSLTLQRVPSWLCGEWMPMLPMWGFEVHHFDRLGRFLFMRNGAVERTGVVRSCVPSPFGPWWELDLSFFGRQVGFDQLLLVMPVSSSRATPRTPAPGSGSPVPVPGAQPNRAAQSLPLWAGLSSVASAPKPLQEHSTVIRTAVVGPTEHIRHRPRHFPTHGRRVSEWIRNNRRDYISDHHPWNAREWVEATLASSADGQDATMIFDVAELSEQDAVDTLPSMEEILAQLDDAEQPSRRAQEGEMIPSVEEILSQLDVEEERERRG
mmetsp:Transcript_121417/g.226945  ORF Transcript_121417/g.226945 Transcript_121417/m.226945 type:complete len:557 (-) Transcript_121417:132-1802(-)